MHGVIETAAYLKDAVAAGMSEDERIIIVNAISANPRLGDRMPGCGGARKARFAMPGKGKRGSYRIIHYYAGEDVPVFLLAVVKKSERADLSQSEKNALKRELAGLAADYRASVKAPGTETERK
jgi:hypothetical protein